MGLIGTIIGLIQMLGELGDPTKVGPAMALALLTTFYGALMANMVFLPVAGKLRNRTEEESVLRAVTIEGIVSIANRDNTIVVEQRLQSFLPNRG
jgi:chemotaxis protein MotA